MQVCVSVPWPCFKNAYSSTAERNTGVCFCHFRKVPDLLGIFFGHGRSSVLLSDLKSVEEVWDPLSILRGQAFLSADIEESLSLKYLGMANLHQIAQNP